MEAPIDVGRREFSAAAIMAMLSGVAISMTGCGGGGSSSPTQPTPTGGTGTGGTGTSTSSDKSGVVSNNHGHSAVVTSVQLTGGGSVALDIRGTATHPHIVSLSSGDIAAIAAGQRVSRNSSDDDGHSHTVTFN